MVLGYASVVSTIPPLLFGIFCKGWENNTLKVVMLLLITSLSFDALSVFGIHPETGKQLLFNLYVLFEFFICWLVFIIYWKERILLLFAVLSSVLFLTVFYVDVVIPGLSQKFSWIENGFSAAVISVCSLWSVNRVLVERREIEYHKDYFFYVSLAMTIYFLGNLVIFIFKDWIISKRPELWVVHNLLHIVFNFILCVAFVKWRKLRLSHSSIQPSL